MTERPSSCPRPSETVGSARAAARHLIPGEQGRVVRNFGKQMLRQHLSAGCWPRMTRASPGPWGLLEGQPDRRAMIAFLSHEERREACRSHACSGAWFTVRRWAVWVSVCARLPPCGVGCILGPRDVYYMTYWISEHVFSEATPRQQIHGRNTPSRRVVGHTPDKIHNVSPKHTALAPCDVGARRQHLVGPSRRSHGDRKRCPPPQKHHQLRTCAHPLLLRDEPQT